MKWKNVWDVSPLWRLWLIDLRLIGADVMLDFSLFFALCIVLNNTRRHDDDFSTWSTLQQLGLQAINCRRRPSKPPWGKLRTEPPRAYGLPIKPGQQYNVWFYSDVNIPNGGDIVGHPGRNNIDITHFDEYIQTMMILSVYTTPVVYNIFSTLMRLVDSG